jgi:hypothetical protein
VAGSKRSKEKPSEDDREQYARLDCARGHPIPSGYDFCLLAALDNIKPAHAPTVVAGFTVLTRRNGKRVRGSAPMVRCPLSETEDQGNRQSGRASRCRFLRYWTAPHLPDQC